MQQPRHWGSCALIGGLLGAGAGAAIGIVIVDNTQGEHSNSSNDSRAWAGGGGAAGGAILGALAGHYIVIGDFGTGTRFLERDHRGEHGEGVEEGWNQGRSTVTKRVWIVECITM